VVAVTYTVEVTREGNQWLADVVGLPGAHTYAGNLVALYDNVYEVIELVLDLPDDVDHPPIALTFPKGDDLIIQAAQIGDERLAAEAATARTQISATTIARQLAAAGYSVRDIAGVLRMTGGRVSQILAGTRPDRSVERTTTVRKSATTGKLVKANKVTKRRRTA
jgi:predicted RNase H-like HicB family nuclease